MSKQASTILFGLIAFIIVWVTRTHFFFWDTVQLTSMHAHWFYENNFTTFFLPREYDSGHPPFWGLYHAGLWKVFGKSLTVSHLAMWPFIFGTLYFAAELGRKLTDSNFSWLFGLFLLADPAFLSQAILVSPDLALSCFFLMTLYGVIGKKILPWAIVLGSIGLAMISMRGMMTLAGLGLFLIFHNGIKEGLRKMRFMLPGVLVGFGFLIIHSLHTQWIGYHEDSPWAESFQLVGIKGFLKNIAVLIWRLMDLGRVYIWILVLAILYKFKESKVKSYKLFKDIFLALSIVLLPTFLLYKGLNGMRYLLPLFLIIDLFFVYIVWLLRKQDYKRWTFLFIAGVFVFASGSTWGYPKDLSITWDSTLKHYPYYDLRKQALLYIHNEKIPINKIATAFPNTAPLEIIDLNGVPDRMLAIENSDAQYYFLSNLFNDLDSQQQKTITRNCKELKRFEKNGIWISIWRKQ